MPVAQNEVEVQHELLTRIADARTQTDRLFEIVKPEALYDRPIPERHRIVFYIGHLEAFDRNLLRERVLGLNTPHPDLDDLFAFGIDPVDGGLPADRPADWPAITDVRAYVTRTRESLETLSRNSDPDPYHGYKMRYVNPASGDYAMPTIGTFIQLLPKGFSTGPYRSTDGTVYVAVEGAGESRVGDQVFRWKPRDIFVAPSWIPVSHDAEDEAVLFSYSDRPVQEKLGLWREQRGNA